jgi:phage shock protein E
MSRRALWTAALALALAAPAAAQVADESAVPRITLKDFKQAVVEKRVFVVDVRDAASYADGHIPGAVNVPLGELQKNLRELKAAKVTIVTYCS